MNFSGTNLATLAILALGALTTVAALVRAGGSSALLSGFTLFALLPYVLFCGACFLSGSNRGKGITTLLVSAAATVFALFVYGDLIFIHPGSMIGLASWKRARNTALPTSGRAKVAIRAATGRRVVPRRNFSRWRVSIRGPNIATRCGSDVESAAFRPEPIDLYYTRSGGGR